MDNSAFIIIAFFILAYGLLSQKLQKSIISPAMVFVVLGFLMSSKVFGVFDLDAHNEIIRTLAEVTLFLVLFTDASNIKLRVLKKEFRIPLRLLGIGMPLSIMFGTLVASVMFTDLSFWEAAVVAAILAPTDAALGKAVVTNKRVPLQIRQSLNVESGLNDGLALPIILICVSLAGVTQEVQPLSYWLTFLSKQIILGPLVGIVIGFVGGHLVHIATNKKWMNHQFHQIASVVMALLSFLLAEYIGGNGFISAFCAGLVTGNICTDGCNLMYEFAEAEGQLLELLTFLIFGNIMIKMNIDYMSLDVFVYALLSLTFVRIVPISISLIGTQFKKETRFFLAWFGPRGIASILFGFLVLENAQIQNAHAIYLIIITTVLVSVFAHGISAYPAANSLAKKLESYKEKELMPEFTACQNIKNSIKERKS